MEERARGSCVDAVDAARSSITTEIEVFDAVVAFAWFMKANASILRFARWHSRRSYGCGSVEAGI